MTGLEGKRALVTGAAGRIGRATAQALATGGATVVVSDLAGDELDTTTSLLGHGHRVMTADLSTVEAVEELVEGAAARLGGLDVLVNNAADLTPGGTVLETTPERFDTSIAVNARAPFFAVRSALPHMLEAGGGSIVNVSSIVGLAGLAGYSAYAVSKICLVQLTRQVTAEYAAQGIRCNAVCPGATVRAETLADEDVAAFVNDLLPLYPMHRSADPSEIAAAIAFLASDAASFVTGAIVPVDGGYTSW